jgi:hypothetical protein
MTRRYRRQLISTLAALAALAFSAPYAWGQGVSIVAPGHSQSHVDLMIGDTARLAAHSDENAKVTWRSGNPTVASVSSTGRVTARKRGYATIRAIAGGDTATIRACVTAVPAETLAAPALRSKHPVVRLLRDTVHLGPFTTSKDAWFSFLRPEQTSGILIDSLAPTTQWGPCLHWFSNTEGVTVDGVGRYTIPQKADANGTQTFIPFAVLGPQFLGAPIPFRKG